MAINEYLLMAATVAGPILAVQAQKIVENWRAAGERRLGIFKTLMATRATILSPRHIEALNMIDIEFHGDPYRKVRAAWRLYFAHLCEVVSNDLAQRTAWMTKRDDLRAQLLGEMGSALGYRFDSVDILKGGYAPGEVTETEIQQNVLRAQASKVLGLAAQALDGGALSTRGPGPSAHPETSGMLKKVEHRG